MAYDLQLPPVGPRSNLDRIQAKLDEYVESLTKERLRRAALTREQALAERLNFNYSREPGEAWHRLLLERYPAEEDIKAFLDLSNQVTR